MPPFSQWCSMRSLPLPPVTAPQADDAQHVECARYRGMNRLLPSLSLLLLLPIFLFLLILSPVSGRPHPTVPLVSELDIDVCVNSSYSRSYNVSSILHCELFNATLSFNSSRSLTLQVYNPPPVVTLLNVHIDVANRTASESGYALNYLFLTMFHTASVHLINTTLHAPQVQIYTASNLTIDATSRITTDGYAPSGLPSYPLLFNSTAGQHGGGGGSGGVGGHGCIRDFPTARGGAACGDPVNYPEESASLLYGGPGSLGASNHSSAPDEEGFGLGGGFILIDIFGADLLLDGEITANGGNAWHSTLPAGGGAGGYVVVIVDADQRITSTSTSLISANGGSGVNGGGGGAGGRIYLLTGKEEIYLVTAYGGDVGAAAQLCPTERGGQGTYYLRTVDSTGGYPSPHIALRCEGPPSIDSLSLIGSTDFSNSSTVDELLLKNCFLLTTPLVRLTTSLRVYSSILQPSPAAGWGTGQPHHRVPFDHHTEQFTSVQSHPRPVPARRSE